MNGDLRKLGTAVTVVIAVSLLVGLVAQIFYILLRRRSLHNRRLPESVLGVDSSPSAHSSRLSSFFFFCRKNPSRIEPQEARHSIVVPPPNNQDELHQELDDIIKWQALYASSRLLFTIAEEEREGMDSETTTYSSCAEREVVKATTTMTTTKVYLEECYGVPQGVSYGGDEYGISYGVPDVPVTVVSIEVDEAFTTPYETPCASPPYETPCASPSRT